MVLRRSHILIIDDTLLFFDKQESYFLLLKLTRYFLYLKKN